MPISVAIPQIANEFTPRSRRATSRKFPRRRSWRSCRRPFRSAMGRALARSGFEGPQWGERRRHLLYLIDALPGHGLPELRGAHQLFGKRRVAAEEHAEASLTSRR